MTDRNADRKSGSAIRWAQVGFFQIAQEPVAQHPASRLDQLDSGAIDYSGAEYYRSHGGVPARFQQIVLGFEASAKVNYA